MIDGSVKELTKVLCPTVDFFLLLWDKLAYCVT